VDTTFLLLDLDDTLVAEDASIERAFRATSEIAQSRYGVDPEALYTSIRRHSSRLWHGSPMYGYARSIGIASWEGLWGDFTGDDPNLRALRGWVPRYRREAWATALAEVGVTDEGAAAEISEIFIEQRARFHEPFPETVSVLSVLRRSCRMALVTNGAPDVQRRKLDESGLAHFFDAVLISGEFGFGKPDPRIFHSAIERLGGSAERSAMVGDSASRDIAGAKAARIKSVWIVRPSLERETHQGVTPDETIGSLEELVPALGRLGLIESA